MDQHSSSLKVSEIFFSIQGESNLVGLPTVFVRLTGCPLRCVWCDTTYAFSGGSRMHFSDILNEISAYATKRVTITGGEPLAQKPVLDFMTTLCDLNYLVSLETSGALPINEVDSRVIKVIDCKAPGSGEMKRNLWTNLNWLHPGDQVKFVIADRSDYEWAKEVLSNHSTRLNQIEKLFSPVEGTLSIRTLAEWILSDGLDVRLQIQLHKLIWGAERGR